MEEETVTISKKRYEDLLDSENMLCCLQSWGVDNWSGYEEAMREYHYGEDD